ncbi:MAG: glutathione S-transferase family protein [Brucellaceae bacterium]|nr:glutathione S-transferase family protein [Brucellaceae bacterium]
MPKIRCAPASPYSAKVRMAAKYAGISFESVLTDTTNPSDDFLVANPLGKIPVLITDDGESIYDSRAITQYLNRVSRNALFPRNAAKRTEAERLEALADGICDTLLAHVYERRFRPEEMWQQSWLDLQWSKSMRGLDALNANPPKLPKKITAGHIAVRALLAYASLRFEGKWERGRSKLVRWAKRFDDKFPELTEYLPKAPPA